MSIICSLFPAEAVFVRMLMLWHDKLLDDLSGHSHMESPNFFSIGNYLVGGQDEPIVASVPQLHSITVWNPSFSESPVESASTSRVEHTWDAPNLIFLVVHCFQGVMAQVCHPCEVVNVVWKVIAPSPRQKDQLAV